MANDGGFSLSETKAFPGSQEATLLFIFMD